MNSFLVQQILFGILIPAMLSGSIYLFLKPVLGKWRTPLALFVGFMAGFFGIGGLGAYAFPPKSIQNWLPHIAIASLILGYLESFWFKNLIARWLPRLILLELFLWQIFQPFINHPFPSRAWTSSQTATNLIATSILIVIFWWGLDYLSSQTQDENRANAILPTGLTMIAASSSLSVVLAHSAIMGQLSGVLTASLGAIAVVAWFRKSESLTPSATPIITMLLVLPWLSIFNTLPVATVIILALSPWFLIFLFKQKSLVQQTAFRLALVLIPVVAAVFSAWQLS